MAILISILYTFVSAGLLSLGIPNELLKGGSVLLGLIALVPLYVALKKSRSYLHAGLLGALMMMLVQLLSSFWLAYFKDFAIFTLGGSALVCFIEGFFAGIMLRFCFSFPEYLSPFLFAAVWTITEWFKSIGFFAYPWGTLVMTSFHFSPLIQIADITGTWGIGFLLALVSAVFGETVLNFPLSREKFRQSILFRTICFSCGLLVLSCTYGAVKLLFPPKNETSLDMVLVQQNADPWEEGSIVKAMLDSENLTKDAIAKANKKPDLVVWSESVLSYPYTENRDYYMQIPKEYPFGHFLEDINTPLLVGSPVLVDSLNDGYSNSVILLSPDGKQLDYHAKIQLVGFAEYLPFTEYALVRKFFDKIVGFSRGWIPGKSVAPMSVANKEGIQVRFATPICFEDAFSDLNAQMQNAGSDILINLTNDSWSKTDSAELQHFVISAFRSIELRTTLVRSTNAGYSVVVGPTGKILDEMPLFRATSKFISVPVYPHLITFYARFGDWFPKLMYLVFIIAAIASFISARKQKKGLI